MFNLSNLKKFSMKMIHRTSPGNAQKIRENGFSLDFIGTGGGLGMYEEPIGIFLSRVDDLTFSKEVETRGLDLKDEILVEIPDDVNIWNPSWEERIKEFKEVEKEYLREVLRFFRREGTDIEIEAVRNINVNIKRLNLMEVVNYTSTPESEIHLKKRFTKHLMEIGYDGIEWKEPAYGVNQLLIFDPSIIKIIR